jgi:hypothetical protein
LLSVIDCVRLYVTVPVHAPEHFGAEAVDLLAATAVFRCATTERPGAMMLVSVSTTKSLEKILVRIALKNSGKNVP